MTESSEIAPKTNFMNKISRKLEKTKNRAKEPLSLPSDFPLVHLKVLINLEQPSPFFKQIILHVLTVQFDNFFIQNIFFYVIVSRFRSKSLHLHLK